MKTEKAKMIELINDGLREITIPVPLLEDAAVLGRGIDATTIGQNLKVRVSPVDGKLLQEECDHLGLSKSQFIRRVVIEAAKALRKVRYEHYGVRDDPR